MITTDLERGIYACISSKCQELRTELIAIGGTEDHVHLLARIPTTLCVADLAKHVKGSSSHLVTHRLPNGDAFKWQSAYGAFSVSLDDVPAVKAYMLRQKEHHAEDDLEFELEQIFEEDEVKV